MIESCSAYGNEGNGVPCEPWLNKPRETRQRTLLHVSLKWKFKHNVEFVRIRKEIFTVIEILVKVERSATTLVHFIVGEFFEKDPVIQRPVSWNF